MGNLCSTSSLDDANEPLSSSNISKSKSKRKSSSTSRIIGGNPSTQDPRIAAANAAEQRIKANKLKNSLGKYDKAFKAQVRETKVEEPLKWD